MEQWKDIDGYEGIYQCSSYGNIRTLDRFVTRSTGAIQLYKGQPIKARANKQNGYLQFALNKNGNRKMVYVHIIVAQTFIKHDDECNIVNHIDGNKTNNRIENLEWCNDSENLLHSYQCLNRESSKHGAKKVDIFVYDTFNDSTEHYKSKSEASMCIGLSPTQIGRYLFTKKLWKGRYRISTSIKRVEDNERVSVHDGFCAENNRVE